MRDSQRNAIYKWQGELGKEFPAVGPKAEKENLSLDECRDLVRKAWTDFFPTSAPPRVSDGRGTSWAYGSRWEISLPRWARYPIVVLHETAHAFVDARTPNAAAHGPEFARILLELLSKYAGIPKSRARSLGVNQKPRRVRFAKTAACPRPVSREMKKWIEEERRLKVLLREHYEGKPER